jgi:hypothetical protein
MSSGHSIKNAPTDDESACQAMVFQVLDQLSQMYEDLGIDKTAADFNPDIIDALVSEQADPNEIEDSFEDGDVSNLDMMRLSCAYAIGALASWSADDLENAWVGIAHAQYWMGVAFGVGFMKMGGQQALSSRGASGAQIRSAKYEPIRQKARELAAPGIAAGDYKNKRQAAIGIKDGLLKFIAEHNLELARSNPKLKGISLGPNQAITTISGWVADMFATKR